MRSRRRKGRKPWRSMTAITLLLAGGMLAGWAAGMYCLTIVTAQEFYDQLYLRVNEFSDKAPQRGWIDQRFNDPYYRDERPDILDHNMLEAIRDLSYQTFSSSSSLEETRLLREEWFPLETAVLYYDGEGNIIHEAGDFVYFTYVTQEMWDAGEEDLGTVLYGWFDLSEGGEDDYSVFHSYYKQTSRISFDIRALRITGVMDGTQIRPAALDYLTEEGYRIALDRAGPTKFETYENGEQYVEYNYKLSDLDRAGFLEWETMFDHRADGENDGELVTIYATYVDMCRYDEDSPLTYRGERYDSLLSLTKERVPAFRADMDGIEWDHANLRDMGEYGLGRILHFSRYVYRDWTDFDATAETPLPEVQFVLVTAIAGYPLRYAVIALRNVYIGTGLLALILVLLLRSAVKKHLAAPLEEIVRGIEDGWRFVYTVDNKPEMWREAEQLHEHYLSEMDHRRWTQNELERLKTALNYVKRAEEDRRQLTSSIAHELKTPLAIIHSYSEGLKEHIAEEKREQYLDVILSEAERMDAMVLEMLDLSRLEAGKVKLARDEFSLSALARSVWSRFAALAEEKGLQIALELDGACTVNADEARIGQVITNFASNAVRYTPEGGAVTIRTGSRRGKTVFSVENTSRPFTQEELAKVWDSFYQTDKARAGRGTGLGLAIAKHIIELHGGSCSVRNTDGGVEFSFTI